LNIVSESEFTLSTNAISHTEIPLTALAPLLGNEITRAIHWSILRSGLNSLSPLYYSSAVLVNGLGLAMAVTVLRNQVSQLSSICRFGVLVFKLVAELQVAKTQILSGFLGPSSSCSVGIDAGW